MFAAPLVALRWGFSIDAPPDRSKSPEELVGTMAPSGNMNGGATMFQRGGQGARPLLVHGNGLRVADDVQYGRQLGVRLKTEDEGAETTHSAGARGSVKLVRCRLRHTPHLQHVWIRPAARTRERRVNILERNGRCRFRSSSARPR